MPLNTIGDVNAIIALLSVNELRNPQNVQVIIGFISDGEHSAELLPHFLVEKNIKIYGGIDLYIDNFLLTFDPNSLDDNGKQGARAILQKMLTYNHATDATRQVSAANIERINQQLRQLSGGKKSKKNMRKRKSKKTKMFKKFVY